MDLASFGASGAVVAVVVLFLNYITKDTIKREATYEKVAIELKRLANSTDKNTMATKSADEYLRKRNGLDMEHHTEVLSAIQAIPEVLRHIADEQSKAIDHAINKQKVTEQVVEHQTVKEHESV